MPRPSLPWFLSIACALGLAAPGCGSRVRECNAMIGKINGALEQAGKLDLSAADPGVLPANLRQLGALHDRLAADVGALGIETTELSRYAGDYQRVSRDLAGAARQMAEAAEQMDPAKHDAAQKRLDRIGKQESELVSKVNAFCGGQP